MSFSNMLKVLQEKNKKAIVLIKAGVFYIATGKDAVFLNKELGLKCVCYKNQVCKIGIPENRLEHYLRKLEKINIGYVVYHFDNKNEILIEKYKNKGKYHIDAKLNCQRIYLRIMYKNKWIDEKKFQIAIGKVAEIGRMVGGLIKYYAKNN